MPRHSDTAVKTSNMVIWIHVFPHAFLTFLVLFAEQKTTTLRIIRPDSHEHSGSLYVMKHS